jgi:hypothetical protein
VGSTITICNRSATPTTFRVSVRVAGAADDNKQYLYYDTPIDGNTTVALTGGLTLAATDIVSVYATLATLSFVLFGSEET